MIDSAFSDRPSVPRPPSRVLLLASNGRWRAVNLLWLVYSAFFITDLLQRGSRRDWLLFAAVYACFLAIYLLLMGQRSDRRRRALLLAMALLGCAYYPLNAAAGGGMLIYVAALIPFMTVSLAVAAAAIVATAVVSAAEGMLLHLSPWTWGPLSL
ncbi:MAG: hypothetical protein ACREFT_16995, partial [Acetobacteraceae bacterium]